MKRKSRVWPCSAQLVSMQFDQLSGLMQYLPDFDNCTKYIDILQRCTKHFGFSFFHFSRLKWDVDKFRKQTVAKDGRDTNQKQRNYGVKLNNYFSYGDKVDSSPTDTQYKQSNNKVEPELNNLQENAISFQVPKLSSQSQDNARPEWKNVYRSESVAAPASGNVLNE